MYVYLVEGAHTQSHNTKIEGASLAREREESDAILPDRSVQPHSVTSVETAVGGGGGG